MPNSPLSQHLKDEVRSYLQNWQSGVSLQSVTSEGAEILLLKSDYHLVAFAFTGTAPNADYVQTYELFKDRYSQHQTDWDTLDVAYVLFVSPDTENYSDFASRIEIDTYFCRKFVIPLSSPVGPALARLPFLPLGQLQGTSLRPASAQTFLQRCGVPAGLARDVVVQHTRGPENIIEDCLSELHGKPIKLKRAETLTEIQGDPPSNPVVLDEITIENFRAYRKAQTFTIGKHVTLFYGPNGFGKTSLFDAIDFAVTGTIGRLETSSDDRFRKLATHLDAKPNEASVTLNFIDLDAEHKLVRTVERPKQALLDNIQRDRKEVLTRLTGGAAVADRVDNLISLFRATHLFSQDSQELSKDFSKDSTISSEIVSRMLAFEDYANAVSKSSRVTELLAGRISKIEDQIDKDSSDLTVARDELNQLKKTTNETANIGALNAEFEALRTELQPLSIALPKGRPDVADIRGARVSLETRIASGAGVRERLVALTKEVATIPTLNNEMGELQPRLDEAGTRRTTADARRNELQKSLGVAQDELSLIATQLGQAQAGLNDLVSVRDIKPSYSNLINAAKNGSAQLAAAHAQRTAARDLQAKAATELGNRKAESESAIDKAAGIRGRLETVGRLLEGLPRWQATMTRLEHLRTAIHSQQSSLDALGPREQTLKQAINENAAEQSRLSSIIESVDSTQSETRKLLSLLQRHVNSGTCPVCGEDHGKKHDLVARLNRQMEKDHAREARAALANVREQGQALAQQLATLQAGRFALYDSTRSLHLESDSLNAEIDGYIQIAATLGIAPPTSLDGFDVLLGNVAAEARANLTRDEQTIRVTAEAAEAAREENENAVAALKAAVSGEMSIKEALDSVRRQLATVLNHPLASRVSPDISELDLNTLLQGLTATLDQHRARQGELTQRITELQSQIAQAGRDVTRAANEQAPLRSRLTAIQQQLAAIAGRLKDAELAEDSSDSELLEHLSANAARQAALQGLQGRIASIEIGLDAVTTAAALSRLRDLVSHLQNTVRAQRQTRSQLKPWQSFFENVRKLVSSEQQAAISNFIEQYGPRTSIIQRRLRSVYGFDDIKLSTKQSEIRVSAERDGEQLPPTDYFSQSQVQTLLLGLFLTACSSQKPTSMT